MTDRGECRSCGGTDLEAILSLGETPLADALVSAQSLESARSGGESRYPLDVAFCTGCSLVQILETVPPDVLFRRDYPYYSSFSDELLRHSKSNADALIDSRGLGAEHLVVELASNDGYLLKNFGERGIPVLGIDPAEGPADSARKIGVETLCEFFTVDLAQRLAAEGKRADVLLANNVLAHVSDTNGFVAGIKTLLGEDGVAVLEVPYLRDLVENCEFDTIYHEHLCYFSVTALDHLFRRHDLFVNRVERYPIHGGSLRLFVEHLMQPDATVLTLLEAEQRDGMNAAGFYRDFADRVEAIKHSLVKLLTGLREQGKRVAAYGAAAKGSTLLNYAGVGTDLVEFVVDRNVHKQGWYMPGQHLPIRAPEALLEESPDYVLILAWNFRDEIMQQQDEYRRRGGRFIVPIPEPAIVGA